MARIHTAASHISDMEGKHIAVGDLKLLEGLSIVGDQLAVVVEMLGRRGYAFSLDGTPESLYCHFGVDTEGHEPQLLLLHLGVVHAKCDLPMYAECQRRLRARPRRHRLRKLTSRLLSAGNVVSGASRDVRRCTEWRGGRRAREQEMEMDHARSFGTRGQRTRKKRKDIWLIEDECMQ